jgi:hypothetical protein
VQPNNKWLLTLLYLLLFGLNSMASPGDENWDTSFVNEITGGEVRSIAVKDGEVYAVGIFTMAGGIDAAHAAKWNGTNWSSLNTHLDAVYSIDSISAGNDRLFVGGQFDGVAGAAGIPNWDGSQWSPVPGIMNSDNKIRVHVSGSNLYTGGHITLTNSSTLEIGKWDGTNWTRLATAASSGYETLTMLTKGTDLYVGGKFTSIAGVNATNLARYDGTNWFAVGGGMNDRVRSLAVFGNDLYAGGDFTIAGNVAMNRIAKWDGTNWSALGSGMNGRVYALSAHGADLYAGGEFSTAGSISSLKLAKWNGASWAAANVQLQGVSVRAITSSGTNLYVGGAIASVNGEQVGNIFCYNDSGWQKLGSGVNFGIVNAILNTGSNLYFGGEWRSMAGTNANSIAKYDGTNWSALGSGLDNSLGRASAYAIYSTTNGTVAGGIFDSAGGIGAASIAQWNGTNWQAFGTGLTNPGSVANLGFVDAITTWSNQIVAGGDFSGPNYYELARWNGTTWSPLGNFPYISVRSFAVLGTNLYVGGMRVSGSDPVERWNGTGWNAVGSWLVSSLEVNALAVMGTNLYAGGTFSRFGSISNFNNIAKWNGTSWAPLGTGVNGRISAMVVVGNDLYVGGYFSTAGGIEANRIAKWDGTNWFALGSGISGTEVPYLRSLAVKGNDLLVGGSFTSAGGKPCPNIAVWHIQPLNLQVQQSGGSFSLSWPAGVVPFALQSTSDLSSTNWSNITQSPGVSNNVYTLVTNSSGSSQFFRLRRN